jgi:hypothetical protein
VAREGVKMKQYQLVEEQNKMVYHTRDDMLNHLIVLHLEGGGSWQQVAMEHVHETKQHQFVETINEMK